MKKISFTKNPAPANRMFSSETAMEQINWSVYSVFFCQKLPTLPEMRHAVSRFIGLDQTIHTIYRSNSSDSIVLLATLDQLADPRK
jgi:hypothetical protein